MIIWNVSALKKANQWALIDPFGQSVLTSLPGQMRPHSMTFNGVYLEPSGDPATGATRPVAPTALIPGRKTGAGVRGG